METWNIQTKPSRQELGFFDDTVGTRSRSESFPSWSALWRTNHPLVNLANVGCSVFPFCLPWFLTELSDLHFYYNLLSRPCVL
jgi:hypothetical protein